MRRAVGITVLLCLLATSAVASSASAATQRRLTRCVAMTLREAGSGQAPFTGACNGAATSLVITPGSVVGRLGGLYTKLRGSGLAYAGRIGDVKVRFIVGRGTITGRYGAHALRFSILGNALSGRVGSARIECSVTTLNPLGEQITCTAPRGGAEAMVPLLAILYTAP
jgi:hypothetical protein